MRQSGRRVALGCSGVLGFVVFAVVAVPLLIALLAIVGDRSAWLTWGVFALATVLGWQAAIHTDRAIRRRIDRRSRNA